MKDVNRTLRIVGEGGVQMDLRLRVCHRNGDWIAAAELQTADGPIRMLAVVNEAIIRRILERRGQTETAGIGDFFKKLARAKAIKQIFATVRSVVKNPTIAKIASAIPYVGTAFAAVNTAVDIADSASSVVAKAQAGDKKALANVAKVALAAKKGNPLAQRTLAVIRSVRVAEKDIPIKAAPAASAAPPANAAPAEDVTAPSWADMQGSPDVLAELRGEPPPVAAGAYDVARGAPVRAWTENSTPVPPFLAQGLLNMMRAARQAAPAPRRR